MLAALLVAAPAGAGDSDTATTTAAATAAAPTPSDLCPAGLRDAEWAGAGAPQCGASGRPSGATDPLSAAAGDSTAGAWRELDPKSPAGRLNAGMAYDEVRDEVVLFGGAGLQVGTNTPHGTDTWVWDGRAWSQRHPPTSPSRRADPMMVFDAARGETVLFGGCCDEQRQLAADTWTWNGTTWTQRKPASSPPGRWFASMVYDAANEEVVLFGGCRDSCSLGEFLNDTWTWDGTTWTQKRPAAAPSPRLTARMAYDGARGEVVLFSGYACPPQPDQDNPCTNARDTWTWDGEVWTQKRPADSPTGRSQATLAFDRVRGEVVLFGGADIDEDGLGRANADTWIWNGATWARRATPVAPPARQAATIAFHPGGDEGRGAHLVLFGGIDPAKPGLLDDTWTWDGRTWTQLPRTRPPNRFFHAMAYDAARREVVLFSGSSGSMLLGDTWTWDGTSWTEHHPRVSPPPRSWANMAYDAKRREVVLYGGGTCTPTRCTQSSDTWTWNGTTWTREAPAQSPPPSFGPAMAFDAARGEVVLVGGQRADGVSPALSEMWVWDGTTWTERRPLVAPPGAYFASMAYDAGRSELVLYGGYDTTGVGYRSSSETWTWDGMAWTLHDNNEPGSGPSARNFGGFAYDAVTQEVVLFGGTGSFNAHAFCGEAEALTFQCAYNNTWAWNGDSWALRDAGSPATATSYEYSRPGLPSHRTTPLVEGPDGRVLMFGGNNGGSPANDMWSYGGAPGGPGDPVVPEAPYTALLGLTALAVMAAGYSVARRRSAASV